MSLLSLSSVSKSFGETPAVKDVTLSVERGEFFGLLGPSGCGKTTTLRMIAGLEAPDNGSVDFDGRDITNLPPERRGFGMVFQNYALFPHMNVFENVAFGLRARGRNPTVREGANGRNPTITESANGSSPTVRESAGTIDEQVRRTLELVQLPGFGKRRVDELSGGQQQRVAIARAIAIEPALLLFDEPLSNLDVALREETRAELRALVKRLNLTAVYVTHDQQEAFALCDRIAVMKDGRVLQIAAPRELYEQPADVSVAKFLGRNNLIRAIRLTSSNDPLTKFKTVDGGHTLIVDATHDQLMHLPVNKPCVLAIRPEAIKVSVDGSGHPNLLRSSVEHLEFSGATTTVKLDASGLKLEALVLRADNFSIGDTVICDLPAEQFRLLAE